MAAKILKFPERPSVDRTRADEFVELCRRDDSFPEWSDEKLRRIFLRLDERLAVLREERS